jgi:hypothetical protein
LEPRRLSAKKSLAVAASAVAAFGTVMLVTAGTASASPTYTATTALTNRPDSGNGTNPDGTNNWAIDTLTRKAVLIDQGVDPNNSGEEMYSLALTDTGKFVTDAGASNPNGTNPSTPIEGGGTLGGTVMGYGYFTFEVPTTATPDPSGVPSSMNGDNGSGTCTTTSCPSYEWPELFFPAGTTITYTGTDGDENVFSYTYKTSTTCEQWVDANTDSYGNANASDGSAASPVSVTGSISGVSQCTATATPTPTPTPSQSQSYPVGGVETGGGKPVSSPWLPFGVGLAVLGGLALAGGVVALRRQRS